MSLLSNLLSALGRSPAAQRAAIPYSDAAKALVAATLGATTIGFVRPIWFISVGRFCFFFYSCSRQEGFFHDVEPSESCHAS